MTPKIVLDTNSLLQILGSRSKYHFLLHRFLSARFVLCLSTEILLEYEEILKLKASPAAADAFLKVISYSRNVIRKDPFFRFDLVKRDYDDNKFSDCAIVCQADFIVTDDSHFREVAENDFPQVNVIGLDDFANMMKES